MQTACQSVKPTKMSCPTEKMSVRKYFSLVSLTSTRFRRQFYPRCKSHPKQNCQQKILKNYAKKIARFLRASKPKMVKSSNKKRLVTILFFKTGHFTSQNGSFRSSKWTILRVRMDRFDMQNGSFWKPEKCKENTNALFPGLYKSLKIRVYAAVRFLFSNNRFSEAVFLHFVHFFLITDSAFWRINYLQEPLSCTRS